MKTPTQYGSENEETTAFIKRIAAPERVNEKRKQKKRMAVVGATVGILAASAACGYAAVKQNESSVTESANLEAASAQFVTPLDDTYYPSMSQLDTNRDGVVSQTEYLTYLQNKKNKDVATVDASPLPEEIKNSLKQQIEANFETDANCFVKAMKRVSVLSCVFPLPSLSILFFFPSFFPRRLLILLLFSFS